MSKVFFINFSGSVKELDESLIAKQKLLNRTAELYANIDESIAWTRDELLGTSFYKTNREVLDQERGAGYWAWKPYIILETLKKAKKDDWVVYCDVGKSFRRGNPERSGKLDIGNVMMTPVDAIIDFAKHNKGFTPGIWIPNYGLAHVWTKRDCFVGMNCDTAEYHNSPHVQAGYSAWSNSKESIDFLEEWLSWCTVPAVISDNPNIYGKPNLAGFIDHRHDQSILSNLCVKHKIRIFGPHNKSLNGYRNFNFILKHMMLSGSHRLATQKFIQLFNVNSSQLPAYLKELLALLMIGEYGKPKTLIHCDLDIIQWQNALPEHTIDIYPRELSKSIYDTIMIPCARNQDLSKEFLYKLFESLKLGGILLLGPFSESKSTGNVKTESFSELIEWIDRNQKMPDDFPDKAYKHTNALTAGSRLNPILSKSNNGKNCYVILTKPRLNLVN